MKYQTYKGYKPMKLNWTVKLSPLIFLACAFAGFGIMDLKNNLINQKPDLEARAVSVEKAEDVNEPKLINYKTNDFSQDSDEEIDIKNTEHEFYIED